MAPRWIPFYVRPCLHLFPQPTELCSLFQLLFLFLFLFDLYSFGRQITKLSISYDLTKLFTKTFNEGPHTITHKQLALLYTEKC